MTLKYNFSNNFTRSTNGNGNNFNSIEKYNLSKETREAMLDVTPPMGCLAERKMVPDRSKMIFMEKWFWKCVKMILKMCKNDSQNVNKNDSTN